MPTARFPPGAPGAGHHGLHPIEVPPRKFSIANGTSLKMRLGNFFALRGRPNDAEFQYKAALRLDHGFSAAAINLADLYRQTGRSQLEETTIRQAISFAPRDAAVNHALGLFTVRRGDLRDALSYLQSAAESDRDNGHSVEAIKYAKMLLAAYPSARGKLLESLEGTSKK